MRKILLFIFCSTLNTTPALYANNGQLQDTVADMIISSADHGYSFLDAMDDFLKSNEKVLEDKQKA